MNFKKINFSKNDYIRHDMNIGRYCGHDGFVRRHLVARISWGVYEKLVLNGDIGRIFEFDLEGYFYEDNAETFVKESVVEYILTAVHDFVAMANLVLRMDDTLLFKYVTGELKNGQFKTRNKSSSR